MTTTISGMSQWLLCRVCVCVRACVCVCVAQLLNRWNAHYAADDNGVQSKVRAPLYLHFPLSSPPSSSTLSPLLPLCPHLSVLPLISTSLSLSPFPFSWVSVTLLCSPWLEACKDGYHISLCSFRATNTHTHAHTRARGMCVERGLSERPLPHFSHFFLQALKVFFCPIADRLRLRTTGRHAGGMQPPHCPSDSVLL